jgi:hypothetical protein
VLSNGGDSADDCLAGQYTLEAEGAQFRCPLPRRTVTADAPEVARKASPLVSAMVNDYVTLKTAGGKWTPKWVLRPMLYARLRTEEAALPWRGCPANLRRVTNEMRQTLPQDAACVQSAAQSGSATLRCPDIPAHHPRHRCFPWAV